MIPSIRVESNSRRKRRVARRHFVYFIEFEGPQLIKVGRTHDLAKRMQEHELEQGCIGRYFSQMEVETEQTAEALERALITEMKPRYTRRHKEWFAIPLAEVAQVISAVVARMPFDVVVRGASTQFFADKAEHYIEDLSRARSLASATTRSNAVRHA